MICTGQENVTLTSRGCDAYRQLKGTNSQCRRVKVCADGDRMDREVNAP